MRFIHIYIYKHVRLKTIPKWLQNGCKMICSSTCELLDTRVGHAILFRIPPKKDRMTPKQKSDAAQNKSDATLKLLDASLCVCVSLLLSLLLLLMMMLVLWLLVLVYCC